MAKKQQRKLTLVEATKELKGYDERKTVELDDNYYIDIDVKFKPTKIRNLVMDVHSAMLTAKEKEVAVDVVGLLSLFIIKHFSDLAIPKQFEKQIVALDTLIDTGYLVQIMDAFDKEEMAKITDALGKANESIKEITKELEEAEASE